MNPLVGPFVEKRGWFDGGPVDLLVETMVFLLL